MTRTALSLALLALAACSRDAADEAPPTPRRIVLVTIDTLRGDHVTFDGYHRDTTPFLAELATRGAVFEAAFSASSLTLPSHSSMLSGVFPPQHGVVTNAQPLPAAVPTVPRALREAGWTSAAFTSVRFLKQMARDFDHVDAFDPKVHGEGRYRANAATIAAAVDWWATATAAEPDRPTFLWLHLFDVHEHAEVEEIDPRLAAADADALAATTHEHLQLDFPMSPKHQALIDRYDTQILRTDAQLRTLYETLEADGAPGLWIVTSDHGEGLGTHGYFAHGKYIYNELIRVPLLLHRSDGRTPAVRVDDLVRTIDLAPTIADAAGATFAPRPIRDEALDARSLLPLLDPGAEEAGRVVFALRRPANESRIEKEGWEPGILTSVQTRRHKYIHHTDGQDELFDLRDDPHEKSNLLAGDAPPAAVLERLKRLHATVLRASGAEAETDASFLDELEQLGYLK